MIMNTVLQEKRRIDFMLEKYEAVLDSLPKGSLSERKVNGKTYYYLKYRDGNKVVSKYIPREQAEETRSLIEKRRHTETLIASLSEERALANRILGGAV